MGDQYQRCARRNDATLLFLRSSKASGAPTLVRTDVKTNFLDRSLGLHTFGVQELRYKDSFNKPYLSVFSVLDWNCNSSQVRLMRRKIIKKKLMSFGFEKTSRISLSCMLFPGFYQVRTRIWSIQSNDLSTQESNLIYVSVKQKEILNKIS